MIKSGRERFVRRASAAPWTCVLALLWSAPLQAQKQDGQLWLQSNVNIPVAPRLRVTLEQIARFGDRAGGLYQTEVGFLVGYRILKGVELGVGYRHVGAHNSATTRDENRIRQQIVATFGRIVTRFRIDERFYPEGDEIGFRIRPLVRYNLPLDRTRRFTAFASHESFYLPNATRWGQRRGYERMRNLAGLNLTLSKSINVDVGYLNQYRPARRSARAQMEHALSLQLTANLSGFPFLLAHD